MSSSPLLSLLTLVIVIVAVTAGVNAAGFVLDAVPNVEENAVLSDGSLGDLVSSRWWQGQDQVEATLHRPLATCWFALIARMGSGRDDAKLFHSASVLLHILVALSRFMLLLALLYGVKRAQLIAFLGALLPALHAVSMESVVSIVGSAELLSSLFMTLCFWTFVVGSRARGPAQGGAFLLASAFCWFMALLAKESSAAFPLVLCCYLFVANRKPKKARPAAFVFTGFLYIAVLVAWVAMRMQVLGRFGIDPDSSVFAGFAASDRIFSALAALTQIYAKGLFFPFGLMPNVTHQDVLPASGFFELRVILGFLLLAGLFLVLVRGLWHKKLGAVFVAMGLLTFLPASNLLIPIGAVAGYRFFYTPLFALTAALLIWIFSAEDGKSKVASVSLVFFGAVAALGIIGIFPVIKAWQSPQSLHEYAYQINPRSLWALNNVIASRHLSGRPSSPEALVASTQAFDVIEKDLARLPGSRKLDESSRILAFRILMNRTGALGNLAAAALNVDTALEKIAKAVSAASRAETYAWGRSRDAFSARLAIYRLRSMKYSLLKRSGGLGNEEGQLVEAALTEDLYVLDKLTKADLAVELKVAFFFEACKQAGFRNDESLMQFYLSEGFKVDPGHPGLANIYAQGLSAQGKKTAAYLALEPVIQSGRAGVPEFFLAAQLKGQLGQVEAQQRLLMAAMKKRPKNPEEQKMLIEIPKIIMRLRR